ncbi:MAG TPA: DUF58 domain-containing protein [Longimicrobium sp.]|nr:DUF58 domain-containing protein [Longimicrobium sp.]
MNLLPAPRLLWLLAAVAPVFLLDARVAVWLDLLILALGVIDGLRVPKDDRLMVDRKWPRRISLGATADVSLTLESTAGRPLRVRVTDDIPPILSREGPEFHEVTVRPGDVERIAYHVRADRRGDDAFGDVHLRVLGPLGLAWRQRRVARVDELRVQPGVREVHQYRLLGLRNRLREAGFRAIRQRGEGGSFESLREYARGDDPRTLDWKATARRGTFIVRQYESERRQNVMIAIDAGRLMTQQVGTRERLDHALTAALLLADVAAVHGDNVGLLVFADRVQQYLPPSKATLARLADALGEVHARVVEPNYPAAFTYLAKQLRRRSLLVIFTDIIDASASAALVAHLGRAAERHLPIAVALRNPDLEAAAALPPTDEASVYRRTAAEELLQARQAALTSMQRSGVLVADTRPQDAVPAVVNRYLDVKRRGLL